MDDKIVVQVWALAVIGKVFIGPWMNKSYSSEMSNLDMVGCIFNFMEFFSFVNLNKNFFQNSLSVTVLFLGKILVFLL